MGWTYKENSAPSCNVCILHLNSNMSKEKKRTRGSSVVDSSDLEQPNISAEFSDFVHSAFDKMGVKMDNIITGQQALEVKLHLCGSSPAKYELMCSERHALVCDRTVFVLSTT